MMEAVIERKNQSFLFDHKLTDEEIKEYELDFIVE